MITRRALLESTTAMLTLAALPRETLLAADASPGALAAQRLYARAFVLDANGLAGIGEGFSGDRWPAMLRALDTSGISAVKSTLGGANGTFEETVADIAATEQLIDAHPERFLKVRVAADLERAQRERKLAVIYSFEAASMIEDKLVRIELFRQLGVRVMQLTYNRRTPLGVGCLDGEEGGLTEIGRDAIQNMNVLGVTLDLSHANTATTAEGIAFSKKPVVLTHTGCHAVFAHPRNKADRELKALAERGGVAGVYMLPFLTPSPKQPTLEDYMAHVAHALKVCGEDHVGIGTDVSMTTVEASDTADFQADVERRKAAGISAPGEDRMPYIPELNTPRKLERVTEALLAKGYSERVAEKVLGLNFRRVFAESW